MDVLRFKSSNYASVASATSLTRCVWEMLPECLSCDISALLLAQAPRTLWYAPCLCCGAGHGGAASVGMPMPPKGQVHVRRS